MIFSHGFDPTKLESTQTCQPPAGSDSLISWSSCGIAKNYLYGITKYTNDVEASIATCKAFDSELITIDTEDVDACAYYSMSLNQLSSEIVLFSGRYFEYLDEWGWCPFYQWGNPIDESCTKKIDYENWLDDSSQGKYSGTR